MTIRLKDLQFRAFHGVYDEERLIGGDFVVNLEVDFDPLVKIINSLADSINYEILFERVKFRMQQPTPLLETLIMELAQNILLEFSMVNTVRISIEKKAPPIEKLKGSVQVSFEARRLDFDKA